MRACLQPYSATGVELALYYLETSALVKLYVLEPGTDRLLEIVSNVSENRLAVLVLSPVEARSAIRRRERAGDIDANAATLILDRLQQHTETRFVRQVVNDTKFEACSGSELFISHSLICNRLPAVFLAGECRGRDKKTCRPSSSCPGEI